MSYKRIETENGIFVITKPDAVKRFLKSYCATICLMIVSVQCMYKHILLHIFLYY